MEVIDTDFHFTPSWKTIRSYLKEPFQSLLFHYPVGSLEYNPEPANEKPGVGQDTHGVAATGADVIKILDQFGTDTVILNPGYNRPQSIFNEPMIAAIAAAHNDYLINEVFPVSPRIKASLMICHRDPLHGRGRNPPRRPSQAVRQRLHLVQLRCTSRSATPSSIRSSTPCRNST